ncbi:hypothetical protein CDL15_Pgr025994 [Punica granatum]|uniref:MIF4G domain-containing protein n=1 Tax=Punica granatum TaxID=22663 RepID=A0A218WB91_PUNGR|nr:hypothetical protein CDL15_Pgr025994 [Punica granatum]
MEHQDGEQHSKQDDEEAAARLEEFKKSIEAKMALRQSNLNPERPDSGFLRSLDSSIKRNTAVIKKLKQINEEQREGLMDELRSVNLSKFVSEAVTAICDAKLRSSDIQAAVQICSLLHRRYKDFSPSLVQGLLKIFFPGKSADDADADRNLKAMKKRSTLKLLLELYFVGVIEDSSIFVNIIKDLTSLEHLKDRDTTQSNLALLASFARQGRVFLGLPLSGQEVYEEFFKGLNITAEHKKIFRKAFHAYYEAAVELLHSEHASLRQMEHENAKILNAKGELSDENVTSYERLRKSYDHLYRNISSLAEALDMQPPVMPEDGHTTRVSSGEDASSPVAGKDSSAVEALWDDEDTRAFYENLPDLRAFVPAVLLGEAEPKVNEPSSKTQEQPNELASESEQGQTSGQDTSEVSGDVGASHESKSSEKGKDKEDKDKEKPKDKEEKDKEKTKDLDKEKGKEKDTERKGEHEKEKVKGSEGTTLDALLQRLPGCVSRDLIDQLTDQMNIETKIRNIRFIGELCKFRIAPAGLVFSCLKACLDDFTHHNIDVACNLLETCGRFLYRSPETTVRMANMLEILMRLKNVKNLDPRHSTLVENAYYLCKPPERPARVSKVRPPLYQYIRKLLFSDLDKSTIEHVLRQLRKLPWRECEAYLLKCFMKVHRGKYGQIHLIASLTAGLSRYHDEFAVAVVDEVLEEIRLGLEVNDYGMQQKRVAHMRFLGELYNYEHVDSSVIFDTLYLILVFGHDTAEQDALDPPEDCFRIRLVITLLQTCGHYFDRGSSKRKLDRFLIHFQRYILGKGALPLDVEFDLQDLFAELRPNMTRYASIEEVNAALIELEEHERTASAEKASSASHSDAEKRSSIRTASNTSASTNGRSNENGAEENGELHEEVMESDSDLASGSTDEEDLDDENHDDSEEDDDEDEDDDRGGGGPASAEEDEVHVRQKVPEVDPVEEANFEEELRAVMQASLIFLIYQLHSLLDFLQAESMEQRRQELRGRPSLNMMIPMNVFEGSAKDHGRGAMGGESGDEGQDEEGGVSKEVPVKVLVKRGNKQQTKQMFIPWDCSLVQSTKQKEAAELEEKQDIKRLVLEYNDREEEELNGLGSQTMNWGQQGGSGRVSGRGSNWDGAGPRSGGTRYRHQNYFGGGGGYYGRRR